MKSAASLLGVGAALVYAVPHVEALGHEAVVSLSAIQAVAELEFIVPFISNVMTLDSLNMSLTDVYFNGSMFDSAQFNLMQ